MHRAAYLTALTLAACALSAPAALALSTNRPAATARTAESLRIAQDFWGQSVADLHVYLATSNELVAQSGIRGTAAYTIGHDIWIDEWLTSRRSYDEKISACDALIHEVGHALNVPVSRPNPADSIHSLAPLSVMRQLQPEWKVVHGCYKRFMPKGKARAWRAMMSHRPVWLTR